MTRPDRFEEQLLAAFIVSSRSRAWSHCTIGMSETIHLAYDGGLGVRPANLLTANLGVRSSNLFGRAS
jgi:hypothetical protein